MSFGADIVANFLTDTLTVTRTAAGAYTTGIYAAGNTSTFTIDACVQPAAGLQRVVGGRDLRSEIDGQHVDDVRVLYTATELRTRTPSVEPDLVSYDNDTWTVMRVELWDLPTSGVQDLHYRVTITRKTEGAS